MFLNDYILKQYRKKQIEKMRNKGAHIGKGVVIWNPKTTIIDCSRPWMLSIGDYVKITSGVIILTHDYSLSVLRRKYGEWIGEGRKTVIGDNCFIGVNSIILMGTQIGNNCIVGAGSVCRGVYPDDSVIAGNPARVICSLRDYYEKRKIETVDEAKACAREYINTYGLNPTPPDLVHFKWLFSPRNKEKLEEYGVASFFCNGDEPEEVEEMFYNTKPRWQGFEEFLEEAKQKK